MESWRHFSFESSIIILEKVQNDIRIKNTLFLIKLGDTENLQTLSDV